MARRLTMDDVPGMLAIYGDPETVRYVGDSEPLPRDLCEKWITVTDRNFQLRGYGMIGFVDPSGDLVACAGVVHPDQQEEAEVKYALRRDQWGKGYATEIVSNLVRHAEQNWGIRRMIATVFPENLPSQKVLTKAGFTQGEDRPNDDGSTSQVWVWTSGRRAR